MIPNIPNPDYVNGSKTVSWLEVREENPDNGVQERLKWLQLQYKKAGGGYKGGKGKKQKALKKWGKEKWMTKDEYEKRKKAKSAAKRYKDSKK